MNRLLPVLGIVLATPLAAQTGHVEFSVRSARNGDWSDAKTWQPARLPQAGDRVLVSPGTTVRFDARTTPVLRIVQVAGKLHFARDRSTELNVALLKVQAGDRCTERGFACDFLEVNKVGEPSAQPSAAMPTLEVGTLEEPIPAAHTARIRLHYLEGLPQEDAPALVCCAGRMEIHGAPLNRTWLKLGADAAAGDSTVTLSEAVAGWRAGDEVILTASEAPKGYGSFRAGAKNAREPQTEKRTLTKVAGAVLTLDRPLANRHAGAGEFRSEAANLSRNVVVESADPAGVRGHTMYHRYSQGGISHARFAHLGKEGVLGRYAIHFHLVGDTMRGSGVVGAAIVDSHNRWVTVHGTRYLVVRDCVGYQSVGHGFFLEDGMEVFNLLDRNLGVQAFQGKALKGQALPFDRNEGAAFWWANGLNTLTRNVGVESDEYGFRYDMQKTSQFDSRLPIVQPDGSRKEVDVRTLPIWRFEDNEAHGNFAGMVVAANGDHQPDAPIRDLPFLAHIRKVDWTGPDARHPHILRNFTIWQSHYAIRPHSPAMLMDGLRIHNAPYGVYRPAFDRHVYRRVHLSGLGPEPFNRGMDDASAQNGSITVDGLTVDDLKRGDDVHPVVHMTDNALAPGAECHFRNVVLQSKEGRRPLFNRGGSVRADPIVDEGVPYYVHDHFGPGRHAKIVSTKAKHLLSDGNTYREERPLTGDGSRVAEVRELAWPQLLNPVDDLPPATVITTARSAQGGWMLTGITHDNGVVKEVRVNGARATLVRQHAGVCDWQATVPHPKDGRLSAMALDDSGNQELTAHHLNVGDSKPAR